MYKPVFIILQDAVTNTDILVRVDKVKKVSETAINGIECRVIHFIDGDTEYVHNSLKSLSQEFNSVC